ncbi:MAG: chemotaxis protein CheB [Burkholderiaceae bacterium]
MAAGRHISIILIESSDQWRTRLTRSLEADAGIRVVGRFDELGPALEFLQRQEVSLVLMGGPASPANGFDATRELMEKQPRPVVLCLSAEGPADKLAARASEAGAVAWMDRSLFDSDPDQAGTRLLKTVKLMSEIKVVRRRARGAGSHEKGGAAGAPRQSCAPKRIVGIGASTGGPAVLKTILSALPGDFAVPVIVVQHIAPGFLPDMVQWLQQNARVKVQIAGHGTTVEAGEVYLAPDGFQAGVQSSGRIVLARDRSPGALCPSVSFLFNSLAQGFGASAVGVLLTGMGKDGAAGLKMMKDRGAVTIVQNSATSVVHGMPGEAIALGAATHIVPADEISALLVSLACAPPRRSPT